MTPLDLRRLDPAVHRQQQRLRAWQQQGLAASLSRPPADASYLRYQGAGPQGEWCALVDARGWLRRQLPQLAAMLPPAEHAHAALSLSTAMSEPLHVAIDELQHSSPPQVSLVSGGELGSAPLPCLVTANGPLWLASQPAASPSSCAPLRAPLGDPVRHLPLNLRLLLGHGRVDRQLLERAAPGDLLVIAEADHCVYLADLRIGRFTLNPQGLTMTLESPPPTPLEPAELQDATVRVQFVLHERPMSLAQLQALEPDALLELPEQAAQQVKVLANGVAIATGELVQLDGRLGVVLATLHRGPGDE